MSEINGKCHVCGAVKVDGKCSDPSCAGDYTRAALADRCAELQEKLQGKRDDQILCENAVDALRAELAEALGRVAELEASDDH